MAEVRRAVPADMDVLLAMGRALHAESPRYRAESYDDAKVQALTERLTGPDAPEDATVFVATIGGAVVGVFGVYIAESWYGHDRKASDLTVYVMPEHRGSSAFLRLLRAAEAWAVSRGAVEMSIGVSTSIHTDKTVRAYERSGYTLSPTRILNKTLHHGN